MMQSLAGEVAPARVHVNSIAPGAIRTPINIAAWQTSAAYERLMTRVPYKRISEPEDIARTAVWLPPPRPITSSASCPSSMHGCPVKESRL